jgi:amino acid transporter
LRQLTAIGVGGIIGAGIFSLAGAVAHETAGPAVLISFLIAGIASAAAAFSYADFAGLIPAPAPPTPTATWCSASSSAGSSAGICYDAMSTAAEESTDSQTHMPKAIMYSLAISMVLYVLACLVLTGMVNYKDISSEISSAHSGRSGCRGWARSSRSAPFSASSPGCSHS